MIMILCFILLAILVAYVTLFTHVLFKASKELDNKNNDNN